MLIWKAILSLLALFNSVKKKQNQSQMKHKRIVLAVFQQDVLYKTKWQDQIWLVKAGLVTTKQNGVQELLVFTR